MDRELRDLYRGAREERRDLRPEPDPGPNPMDVPSHDRATGFDDPVPDAEYDDGPRTGWYEVLRAYLDMREDLRHVLDPDRAPRSSSVEAVESRTTQTTIEGVTS